MVEELRNLLSGTLRRLMLGRHPCLRGFLHHLLTHLMDAALHRIHRARSGGTGFNLGGQLGPQAVKRLHMVKGRGSKVRVLGTYPCTGPGLAIGRAAKIFGVRIVDQAQSKGRLALNALGATPSEAAWLGTKQLALPHPGDRRYDPPNDSAAGPPVWLDMIGDFTVRGAGEVATAHLPGPVLATRLAAKYRHPFSLSTVALFEATAGDLSGQVDRLQPGRGVSVICIGANDLTHLRRPTASAPHLGRIIDHLHALGRAVVVVTSPDWSIIPVLPAWVRPYMGGRCTRLAEAQHREAKARAHEVVICPFDRDVQPSLGVNPGLYFADDGVHPSAEWYGLLSGKLTTYAARALYLSFERNGDNLHRPQ